jgi:PncC family amidohydrolase
LGAVSEEVARAMAEGALAASGADLAVSVTGIAGPGGGTEEKPVGTAWLAVAQRGAATEALRIYHPRSRKDFKLAVSQSALEAVRRRLNAM